MYINNLTFAFHINLCVRLLAVAAPYIPATNQSTMRQKNLSVVSLLYAEPSRGGAAEFSRIIKASVVY